jgi:hypothetical protein
MIKHNNLRTVSATWTEIALREAPGRNHQPAERSRHPPALRELQLSRPQASGAGVLRRKPQLHHEGHQMEDDREGAAGAVRGGDCSRGSRHVQSARGVSQERGKQVI